VRYRALAHTVVIESAVTPHAGNLTHSFVQCLIPYASETCVCVAPESPAGNRVDWTKVDALPRPAPARPRLLVIDDEIPVFKVIERHAARVGYDVITFANGTDALEVLVRKRADLAMVDLRMPAVNGLDLLRQIRSSVRSCEVMLMTGYAGVDSAVDAIKLGAREILFVSGYTIAPPALRSPRVGPRLA